MITYQSFYDKNPLDWLFVKILPFGDEDSLLQL